MSPTVTLTITTGSLDGREHTFDGPCVCTVGRSADCDVRLPNGWEFLDISRHHCQLMIDPPWVRVRDFGSRNGTYVNGILLGQGEEPCQVGRLGAENPPVYELHDGDLLRVGHVIFRVTVSSPVLVAS